MKRAEKIKKLLQEKLEKNNKNLLSEEIVVKKTLPREDGSYYIVATSDSKNSFTRVKENGGFGNEENLTKKNQEFWKNRFPEMPQNFPPPGEKGKWGWGENVFGWGYKIIPGMSQETADRLLKQLNTLADEYNAIAAKRFNRTAKKSEITSSEQLEMIYSIAEELESAESYNEMPEIKANFEKYLDNLYDAIDQGGDAIYQFLSDSYKKTREFRKRNLLFYKYSYLNSLIIRTADPMARFAATEQSWYDKGYRIKPNFRRGISIRAGSSGNTTFTNALWFKTHEAEWRAYKSAHGLPRDMSWDSYVTYEKDKDKKDSKTRMLAYFGLNNNYYTNQGTSVSRIYTDTMIEPIPEKEQVSLDSMEFYVEEDPIESLEGKEKVNALFDALSIMADKMKINTVGIVKGDGDVNQLNRLLSKVAYEKMTDRFSSLLKDKTNRAQNEEMLKGFAELAAGFVREHYGLPSKSSVYSVSSFGVEKQEAKKNMEAIQKVAFDITLDIEELTGKKKDLKEVRTFIFKTLLKHLLS